MNDSLVIQLETPIKIPSGGDFIEVELLTVKQCSFAHFNLYADIKSIVTKAMLAFKDGMGNDEVEKAKGGEESVSTTDSFPLDMFAFNGSIQDLSEVVNKYLILNATFDDVKVNKGNLERLSMKDYTNILERVSYFLYQT